LNNRCAFDALIVVELLAFVCLDVLERSPVSLDAPDDSPVNRWRARRGACMPGMIPPDV
jgi:hypothetical protein